MSIKSIPRFERIERVRPHIRDGKQSDLCRYGRLMPWAIFCRRCRGWEAVSDPFRSDWN